MPANAHEKKAKETIFSDGNARPKLRRHLKRTNRALPPRPPHCQRQCPRQRHFASKGSHWDLADIESRRSMRCCTNIASPTPHSSPVRSRHLTQRIGRWRCTRARKHQFPRPPSDASTQPSLGGCKGNRRQSPARNAGSPHNAGAERQISAATALRARIRRSCTTYCMPGCESQKRLTLRLSPTHMPSRALLTAGTG